jgi:hypothetical protein
VNPAEVTFEVLRRAAYSFQGITLPPATILMLVTFDGFTFTLIHIAVPTPEAFC